MFGLILISSRESVRIAPCETAANFPYYDGVTFELEVLKRGGTHAAFAGVFARPPLDTHEIMQPEVVLALGQGEQRQEIAEPNANRGFGGPLVVLGFVRRRKNAKVRSHP